MNITKLLAYMFCGILFCLGIFQIALIFGAPFGNFSWGGQNKILTPELRFGSFVSLFIYAFFCLVVLQKANIYSIFKNKKIANIGIWIIVGYSFLGILMNAASRSLPEKFTMTPLVIILAISSLVIAIKTKNKP